MFHFIQLRIGKTSKNLRFFKKGGNIFAFKKAVHVLHFYVEVEQNRFAKDFYKYSILKRLNKIRSP